MYMLYEWVNEACCIKLFEWSAEKHESICTNANLLSCVFIFQQGLGLLFTDDGSFDLWGIHVYVQLASH